MTGSSGEGVAGGAITVLNAIPNGAGAAIGTTLEARAKVQVQEGEGPIVRADGGDARLVQACYRILGERAGQPLHGQATTHGPPEARGLKSSHSVGIALVRALADALDLALSPREVLELVVQASREAGVTVTGAWDDAAACLAGGLNVTRSGTVIKQEPIPDHDVVLLVPPRTRHTEETPDLTGLAPLADRALALALDGQWAEALTLNGWSVAATLEEPLSPPLDALRAGAVAAGLTGTGPAMAAVCTPDATPRVVEALEAHGPVLTTRTRTLEVDLCTD